MRFTILGLTISSYSAEKDREALLDAMAHENTGLLFDLNRVKVERQAFSEKLDPVQKIAEGLERENRALKDSAAFNIQQTELAKRHVDELCQRITIFDEYRYRIATAIAQKKGPKAVEIAKDGLLQYAASCISALSAMGYDHAKQEAAIEQFFAPGNEKAMYVQPTTTIDGQAVS